MVVRPYRHYVDFVRAVDRLDRRVGGGAICVRLVLIDIDRNPLSSEKSCQTPSRCLTARTPSVLPGHADEAAAAKSSICS